MRLPRLSEVLTERRRSPRREGTYLRLAYWNGSEGVVRRIGQVNSHGAYVITTDRWFPGTVMLTQFIAEMPSASKRTERNGAGLVPSAQLEITEPRMAEGRSPGAAEEIEAVTDCGENSEPAEVTPVELVVDSAAEPVCEPETETFSIPIIARVVRSGAEGIFVEFVFRNSREHRALTRFLMAVEERRKIVEARECNTEDKARKFAAGGSGSITH